MSEVRSTETNRTIEAVWRVEAAKVVATLTRMVGDLSRAEDLAQDALIEALQKWPESGIPRNPAAWLTAVGKRRAIDAWRRDERQREKYGAVATLALAESSEQDDLATESGIEDDLMRLVFVCCHPVLAPASRVALTLRVLCGLSTDEIARAYLVPSATMGQRITRAKRTLAAANVPFEIPDSSDYAERLDSVLEVIYLMFNEGYAATSGDEWMRPLFLDESLRLGRIVASLVPRVAEANGLVALMELHASRFPARRGADGEPVLLLDQDRSRWDRLLINHGLEALARAERLGGQRGSYTLQAAIAACHARARSADDTDWVHIASLYEALASLTSSPIVELNRAVAVGMAYGAEAGLQCVDALSDSGALGRYPPLPAVRADLLEKLGRAIEARDEFLRAATLTQNERERATLIARAAGLVDPA